MQEAPALRLIERDELGWPTSREAFDASPHLTMKWSSYFEVYDELFAPYRGKPITFVEVGVLNGGSLFMWREFFGPDARIIGVDLNPAVRKWEAEGFEMFIGDQSDPAFWQRFRDEVGPVDVLLDDGGHTYAQQIITADAMLPAIRDGGLLVVEDTHTSYMSEFGGPSQRSFVSWAKNLVDGVNNRIPDIGKAADRAVHRVSFFTGIVGLHVDRARARRGVSHIPNRPDEEPAPDYRYVNSIVIRFLEPLRQSVGAAKSLPLVGAALLAVWRMAQRLSNSARTRRLGHYFRY